MVEVRAFSARRRQEEHTSMKTTQMSADIDIPAFSRLDGPFVSYLLLCDTVIEEKSGTMSFVRMIEKWTVANRAFPIVPHFWICVGLRAIPETMGDRTFHIWAEHEETGNPLLRAQLTVEAGGDIVNFIVPIDDVSVERDGFYRLSVIWKGKELSYVRFQFEQVDEIPEELPATT